MALEAWSPRKPGGLGGLEALEALRLWRPRRPGGLRGSKALRFWRPVPGGFRGGKVGHCFHCLFSFSSSSLSFSLRILLFTHLEETPEAEILFPIILMIFEVFFIL